MKQKNFNIVRNYLESGYENPELLSDPRFFEKAISPVEVFDAICLLNKIRFKEKNKQEIFQII